MRITAEKYGDEAYADGVPLDLAASLKVWNHSPTGFSWGYYGSGPAQLALAILLLVVPEGQAVALHQEFKRTVVATWQPNDPLDVEVDVEAWLDGRS